MVKLFTAHRIRGSSWSFDVNSTRQPTEITWVNNKLNKIHKYSGNEDQVTSKIGELFAKYARDDNFSLKLSLDSDYVKLGAPKSLRPMFPSFTETSAYSENGSYMSFDNADDVQPCVLKIFNNNSEYCACLVNWQGNLIGMSLQNWLKIVPLWKNNLHDLTLLVGLHRDGTMEFVDFISNSNEDNKMQSVLCELFPAKTQRSPSKFMFGLNPNQELTLYKPYIDIGFIVKRYITGENAWALTYAAEVGDDSCHGETVIKLITTHNSNNKLYAGAVVRMKAIVNNGLLTRIVGYEVTPDLDNDEDFTCEQINAKQLYPHNQLVTC